MDITEKPKRDMKFLYGFFAGFAIMAMLAFLISLRQPVQPIVPINYSKPATRVEVCINMSESNSIHLITNIPYNSTISEKSYGWATLSQFRNWSNDIEKNNFGLSHNNILC